MSLALLVVALVLLVVCLIGGGGAWWWNGRRLDLLNSEVDDLEHRFAESSVMFEWQARTDLLEQRLQLALRQRELLENKRQSMQRVATTAWLLSWVAGARSVSSLHLPPGTTLAEWLTMIFGRRVYRELLEQHLLEYQAEWQEAHADNQLRLARWIRVRCWIVLLWSVLGALPIEKVRALLMGETGDEEKKKGVDD